MSLTQILVHDAQTVESVLKRVIAGYQHAVASPTVEHVIADFPQLAHLSTKIAELIPGIQTGMAVADLLITYGPTLYAIGTAAGMKPHDAKDGSINGKPADEPFS